MLVLMKRDASEDDILRVTKTLSSFGFVAREIPVDGRMAIAVTGDTGRIDSEKVKSMPGVEHTIPVSRPYKLAGREFKNENSEINVDGETIGGKELAVIAGPCAVENWEQVLQTAEAVKDAGAKFLRGGAYKPRTSPYAFQGLKKDGLKLLAEAKAYTGLKIVTEVKDVGTLISVAQVADVLQIGARNMTHYSLLEAVGDLRIPVLLKRGISSTIEEFLMAAEYILSRGNQNVILCERGIRTFEPYTRNTLDLNAIPIIKKLSHLPIIVDPSHGIGIWDGVAPMALAAIAAGADGLLIEVHPDPSHALSDGHQSLKPDRFKKLMERIRQLAPIVGRTLGAESVVGEIVTQ